MSDEATVKPTTVVRMTKKMTAPHKKIVIPRALSRDNSPTGLTNSVGSAEAGSGDEIGIPKGSNLSLNIKTKRTKDINDKNEEQKVEGSPQEEETKQLSVFEKIAMWEIFKRNAKDEIEDSKI